MQWHRHCFQSLRYYTFMCAMASVFPPKVVRDLHVNPCNYFCMYGILLRHSLKYQLNHIGRHVATQNSFIM